MEKIPYKPGDVLVNKNGEELHITYFKNMNNCSCCLASYDNYIINKESELFHSWCEIPNRSKDDNKIIEPKGLCGFCNPKSTIWFIPSLTCHNKLDK